MNPDGVGDRGLHAQVRLTLGSLALDVALHAPSDQTIAVVGPNGAGKTTLLRTLCGLVRVEHGSVTLDGTVLEDPVAGVRVPPEDRPVGVVFQDLLLFPHLSVTENVAFGLRSRGRPRGEARRQALAWLDRLEIGHLAGARPSELSRGQAQRVALARAMAPEPRLLLLDEPTSSLDAGGRADVRRELARHLSAFPGPRLVVTHDPVEALTLADGLVVVERGRVVQTGGAAEVAARPRSSYVAELVGTNLYRGRADRGRVVLDGGGSLQAATPASGEVFALVHPRAVSLHRAAPHGTPRNVWKGLAGGLDGNGPRVRLRVSGSPPIVAEVTQAAVAELSLGDGGPVWVSVKATEVDVYPA